MNRLSSQSLTRFVAAWALLVLLGSGHPLSAQSDAPPGEYEVAVAKNVVVPLWDGVRLATDIYRPARNGEALQGPFPTLPSRTPYGKNGSDELGRFLASHGYVVVIQDVRGRYESEGTFYIYVNEGPDGYDAVEWLAKQPWSNGDVGTFGGSYLAATQNALAMEAPPHLRSMFIRVSTSNYWEDGAGSGGAFALLHNLAHALSLASVSPEAQADPPRARALAEATQRENLAEWIRAYPFNPGTSPVSPIPTYQRWFQDWVDHSELDEYWKQNGYMFELYHDWYPDIPIYYIGGWYDIFLRGTLNNYAGLSKLHSSPTRLMVGPWEHGVGSVRRGDVAFGPQAEVSMQRGRLRWFDQTLKGEDTGVLEGLPVKLFIMGGGDGTKTPEGKLNNGGEWVQVEGWPPPQATATAFYFHADGSLRRQRPSASPASTSYTFDPENPVPTIGGKTNSGAQLVPPAPFDQRCIKGKIFGCKDNLPLSARRDVIVFQTPPLEEDVVIMGSVTVTLWVSSSTRDTDFTAKLIDVYPPSEDYPWGYDMLLADRILRARYRNGLERAELMEPGEVYEITIDLLGTANRFQKGHRIRLDISSSNFPFFDVNPNTGERLGHHTHMVKAVNTIYLDGSRPSRLVLPIVRSESRVELLPQR